jgi:AcrR family transcriptional regulator
VFFLIFGPKYDFGRKMLITKDDIIKEEILKEAQKLFQQFGVKKTTMEDIAKAMGKGKSTLYYYYCSKEDIFDAVVQKEMGEVFHYVKQAVEKAETAEEKLKVFTLSKIKAVQKRANLCKIVKGEIQDTLRCMKHLHEAYDLQETNLVKEILEFGIRNGEFSKQIKKDLDILPSVMVSSLRGLERDLFTDKYAKLESRMESIMGIMMRGLKNVHQPATVK